MTPAFRPLEALAERENNRIDPLFAERKRGGRPQNSDDQYHRSGVLAALVNFWIEAHPDIDGLSVQLSTAARQFRGRWFGNVSAAHLKSARELVSQEAKDHLAVAAFDHFDLHIRALADEFGPEQALAVTIRILNEAPASTAMGNWRTIQSSR
jgi:hypothetical protein